jgi:hypothetical protein
MSNQNAKSQILELLKNLGCSENAAKFHHQSLAASGPHRSTLTVYFPDSRVVQGQAVASRVTDADIQAAQAVLDEVGSKYPDLLVDWNAIGIQAQAGDALIKLGVYLSTELDTAGKKSQHLQQFEADSHLAQIFDRWKAKDDPDLAIWGNELGEKRKATVVEALLWRRFGAKVIAADAATQLQAILRSLTG